MKLIWKAVAVLATLALSMYGAKLLVDHLSDQEKERQNQSYRF